MLCVVCRWPQKALYRIDWVKTAWDGERKGGGGIETGRIKNKDGGLKNTLTKHCKYFDYFPA